MLFNWVIEVEILWAIIRKSIAYGIVIKRWQENMLLNIKKEGISIHVPIKLRRMIELLIVEKWS
jgi:hypothetical protein